ncbi:hypothetical protein CLOSAC_06380 [Clostridium saccharobutylicum]|uniref:Uncharacterized protein n=1 Tax=Clostridium saccharobutylicum TaxID=169679 RepID=A0A1S8NIV0_CLOSA|nr:hypothetical protein CLOSAC_06380 [Clostridium saccharobutylicum]
MEDGPQNSKSQTIKIKYSKREVVYLKLGSQDKMDI